MNYFQEISRYKDFLQQVVKSRAISGNSLAQAQRRAVIDIYNKYNKEQLCANCDGLRILRAFQRVLNELQAHERETKPSLSSLKMHELRTQAKDKGLKITAKTTKKEIIELINRDNAKDL